MSVEVDRANAFIILSQEVRMNGAIKEREFHVREQARLKRSNFLIRVFSSERRDTIFMRIGRLDKILEADNVRLEDIKQALGLEYSSEYREGFRVSERISGRIDGEEGDVLRVNSMAVSGGEYSTNWSGSINGTETDVTAARAVFARFGALLRYRENLSRTVFAQKRQS